MNTIDSQTGILSRKRVQCAFKDLMIHGILQFTLRIAFRCVLHRCESLEIRCQKLFIFIKTKVRLVSIGVYTNFGRCLVANLGQRHSNAQGQYVAQLLVRLLGILKLNPKGALENPSNLYNTIMIQPQVHLRLPCYDF